jgi:predicted HD phosphohydrolase
MSPKMSTTGQPIVELTAMKDGTYEDYQLIERLAEPVQARVGEHLLQLLQLLKMLDAPDEHIGHPISRYQHSLQSATRALRAGEDDEMVVAALLHDVGDVVAPHHHPEAAAAIVRPFVSERVAWIVEKHGVFQGLYYYEHIGLDKNAREKYRTWRSCQAANSSAWPSRAHSAWIRRSCCSMNPPRRWTPRWSRKCSTP